MEKRGKKNKKAVSLMVSYVLLISIVIIISIGVFFWLKFIADISPPTDCKEGTSLVLDDYTCTSTGSTPGISLDLKNNGRFNIDGVILSVGNDTTIFPITYLAPEPLGGIIAGHYFFIDPISPGNITTAQFLNIDGQTEEQVTFNEIKIIQIQPFILYNDEKVVCQNAVIKQEIDNCQIV